MTSATNANAHVIHLKDANRTDPNIHPSEHAHELGGTFGMAVGGVAGGILSGVVAGGAIGGIAGPIGAVAGAAIGGALGGSAGEEIARDVNPTREEEYWETQYRTRPYIAAGHDFSSYRAAYRSGIDGYASSNPNTSFESLEPSLRNNWNIARGESKLEWTQARHAARDAFNRLSNASM